MPFRPFFCLFVLYVMFHVVCFVLVTIVFIFLFCFVFCLVFCCVLFCVLFWLLLFCFMLCCVFYFILSTVYKNSCAAAEYTGKILEKWFKFLTVLLMPLTWQTLKLWTQYIVELKVTHLLCFAAYPLISSFLISIEECLRLVLLQ